MASKAGARRSSQPIVAEPNVASCRRGIDGSDAAWSALDAGWTSRVPHTRTTSTTATRTSPAAIDHAGAMRATSCATVIAASAMSTMDAVCATSPSAFHATTHNTVARGSRTRPAAARSGVPTAPAHVSPCAPPSRRPATPAASAAAGSTRPATNRVFLARLGGRAQSTIAACTAQSTAYDGARLSGRELRAGCGSPPSSATSTRSPATRPSALRRSAAMR